MPFVIGKSGNPAGKPKGTKDKRTELRSLLQPHAEDLVKKAVAMAKAGDVSALRICIDRIIPPVKDSRISIDLPKLTNAKACVQAQSFIVEAVAIGELLPSEGEAISSLVENQRRSFETQTLEERLKAIEEHLGRGNP